MKTLRRSWLLSPCPFFRGLDLPSSRASTRPDFRRSAIWLELNRPPCSHGLERPGGGWRTCLGRRTTGLCRVLQSGKSLSAETTFNLDTADLSTLEDRLWPLCEKVALCARKENISGRAVTLKLKRADFKIITRRRTLSTPTQTARTLFCSRAGNAAGGDVSTLDLPTDWRGDIGSHGRRRPPPGALLNR